MDGWERVDVLSVGKSGEDGIVLAFVAQTPSDRITAGGTVTVGQPNSGGHLLIQGSNRKQQEFPFPDLRSQISGRHQPLPEDSSRRRRALTPGLAELDSHYDEQLLVRVAPLLPGAASGRPPAAAGEELSVPAGKFGGAVMFSVTAEYFERPWFLEALASDTAHHPVGPVKIWIHDQVPATGIVKMEFPSGAILELLDFGRGGDPNRPP